MRRTPYQQALDEIGANRKLREEIEGNGEALIATVPAGFAIGWRESDALYAERARLGRALTPEESARILKSARYMEVYGEDFALTDLDAIAMNIRNPARYEWVKLAVTLALLGLSVWLVVWLLGRHG